MKQIYFLTLFFMGLFSSQAQFTLATHDGDPITDGSIFTFNQLGTDADLSFNITNTSSGTIDMRLEYVNMTNGDGSGTWLCVFGSCMAPGGISVGDVFPSSGTNSFTTIDAGVTTDFGDHFYNTYEGDGENYPIDYVFKFFQVDASGNEIGNPISFTYRYDGTASLEEKSEISYSIYPNVSNDFININTKENIDCQIITIQGQIIQQFSFQSGINTIDVSNFSKQMYYLLLTNKNGKRAISKIIVK